MNSCKPGAPSPFLIQRNAQYGEILILISLVGFYYIGILGPARSTPAGPKVHQDILPAEIGQPDHLTRRVWQLKIRGQVTDSGSLFYFDEFCQVLSIGAVLISDIESGIQRLQFTGVPFGTGHIQQEY